MLLTTLVCLAMAIATIVSYFLGPHGGDEHGPLFGDGDNLFMLVLAGVSALCNVIYTLGMHQCVERSVVSVGLLTVTLLTLGLGELWLFFAERPLRKLFVSVLGDRRIEWNYRKIRYGASAALAAGMAGYHILA